MSKKLNREDEQLLEATKHAVSRNQDIPPTPGNTLAVIMQAAEKEKSAFIDTPFPLFSMRTAVWSCLAVLLITGIGLILMKSTDTASNTISTSTPSLDDLGLDVAAWNMEFESLQDDFDDTYSDFADEMLITGGPWL